MVMGVDSRSKGRGFESQRRILDGHFFTLICCKNCIVCLKRPKINKKEAGVGPILKKRKEKRKKISVNIIYHLVSNGIQTRDLLIVVTQCDQIKIAKFL